VFLFKNYIPPTHLYILIFTATPSPLLLHHIDHTSIPLHSTSLYPLTPSLTPRRDPISPSSFITSIIPSFHSIPLLFTHSLPHLSQRPNLPLLAASHRSYLYSTPFNFSLTNHTLTSHRDPISPSSLHHIDPTGGSHTWNPYQLGITSVCNVVEAYDTDKVLSFKFHCVITLQMKSSSKPLLLVLL
jgi:hypothetical protein